MATSKSPLVLCYHGVSESWGRSLSVTPQRLAEQLGFLLKRGFRGVTFTEAVTAAPVSKPTVAITFDDGYRSVIELAKPILDRHEIPATVFVPTSFIGSEAPMAWPGIDGWRDPADRRELVPMSWAELRQLTAAGWEIGAHTRTHPRLSALGDRPLEQELSGSRGDLERQLGAPCTSVAYPYGDFDARVARAAATAGYLAGATLMHGLFDDAAPLECPRVGVYAVDEMRRFRLKVSGLARRALGSSLGAKLRAG